MDPNNYQPPTYPAPPPPPAPNPYDFLNTPSGSSKPLSNLVSQKPLKTKLLIYLTGALLIVILLYGIKSIFSGNNGVNMPSLYNVLSQQLELNQLANTGTTTAYTQSYINFSYTVLGSTFTDQSQLTTLLTDNHIAVNQGLIVTNPTLESQLTQAQQLTQFDSVYGPMMLKQLEIYKSDLSTAYSLNKSPVIKKYLSSDYRHATLLITMYNSPKG